LSKFPVLDDAERVLSAVRLGWGMAEARGRNRPGGPPGESEPLPAGNDHALPLRIERTPTELRIEAQSLIAALARRLHVDTSAHGMHFGRALDDKAKLLAHARAEKAVHALQSAVGLLTTAQDKAAGLLAAVTAAEHALRAAGKRVVTAAEQVLTSAENPAADPDGGPAGSPEEFAEVPTEAGGARAARDGEADGARAARDGEADGAQAARDGEADGARAARDGEAAGRAALTTFIDYLKSEPDLTAAAAAGRQAIERLRQDVAGFERLAWESLAELIWKFDAHIQDGLAAASETEAIGYQVGRGLAETYWALDAGQVGGATGWTFLLGNERCTELSRLVGRLGAYMCEYTAPAIAGSIDVWKAVAANTAWRGDPADPALYNQIRRWYELIILGQDPTTLITPMDIFRAYRTIFRTLRWFLPELAELVIGLGGLGFLIYFLGANGSATQKALSGILTAVGLSVASVSGKLKNSEQALLKRLRQDAYTDLVVYAVQTAPNALSKRDLRKALAHRQLTPATPN
jgi:hypothetical protein